MLCAQSSERTHEDLDGHAPCGDGAGLPATVSSPAPASSTWAPLRIGVFRALWLAVLVSNIGLWMQTVGAQWLLVSQPHASILVALVQTADMLPDVLFGLVGGVLADSFDRRRLLIIVQVCMAVAGAALTVLTIAGQMPPALLLTFTFVLGTGSVVSLPAYQSLIPDLVPRSQLASAAALGSVSINVARAVGPAIAGVLIARVGVAAVFAIDTVSFVFYGVVVAAWRSPPAKATRRPERFGAALRAGTRYVWYAPVVRRVLLRLALFLLPGSALWALLPLVATERLGQGAGGYGLLLGALGVGAVAGVVALPRLRARLSSNPLLALSGITYAAALVAVVLGRSPVLAVIVLLPAGAAWVAVISSINAGLQLFLPSWVRARGLSVYLTVLFGTQALGAVFWGLIAAPIGLVAAFLIAAGLMVAGVATIRIWPLFDTTGMDRSTAAYWAEPQMALEVEPSLEAVVVRTTYTVAPEREQQFLEIMARVRRSRLRTGAVQWGLFRDAEVPDRFVELFAVPSWDEHMAQHTDRLTGADREWEDRAEALSEPHSETSHLIATEVPD
jgi:MFS family permease